ncbi:glycosyltransferase [Chloroflexota bacterium]
MRILIIHFRSAPAADLGDVSACVDPLDSAGTDGVSLEIVKRQTILEEMGHEVKICSAYNWADFPVEGLEFESEEVVQMVQALFGPEVLDSAGEIFLKKDFYEARVVLKKKLSKVVDGYRPDLLFVHNMLCLPIHPVATVSLTELVRERRLPCVAIHHDVLSEGAYKFTPTCAFAESILQDYYPPTIPNLSHWTINTRNRRALADRGVDARIIHDSMDFDHVLDPDERVMIRAKLRAKYGIAAEDVVLLAAARIVPNKQTELAGRLTSVLQGLRQEPTGKKLYNGEELSQTSRTILVLAGRPERSFAEYQKSLFQLFDELEIDWIYVGEAVRPRRCADDDLHALYPDVYSMADLVLYPTGWEGFGNQLLEAFAAELPVAVFEYPVFQEDIAPRGVTVVTLGDKLSPITDKTGLVNVPREVLNRAAQEIMEILTDPQRYRSIIEQNVIVGRRSFGFDVLRAHLSDAIHWASDLA